MWKEFCFQNLISVSYKTVMKTNKLEGGGVFSIDVERSGRHEA